jgi:hypothetical protein
MDAAAWEAPWIGRVLSFFQRRPAYVGVVGAAACALLLTAIVFSESPPRAAGGPQGIAGTSPVTTGTEGSPLGPIGALPQGTTLFDKMPPLQGATPVFSQTTNLLNKQ